MKTLKNCLMIALACLTLAAFAGCSASVSIDPNKLNLAENTAVD